MRAAGAKIFDKRAFLRSRALRVFHVSGVVGAEILAQFKNKMNIFAKTFEHFWHNFGDFGSEGK